MSFPKVIAIVSFVILGTIGLFVLFQSPKKAPGAKPLQELVQEIEIAKKELPTAVATAKNDQPKTTFAADKKEPKKESIKIEDEKDLLPEANRIEKLFITGGDKLPFVETISYSSRVPWLKGRPAWIADYASYYQTTRHFIARSLNKKADYFTQEVGLGDKFNVLKKDMDIRFHILIDVSRSKLWFYYYSPEKDERILLKTYRVGLGRKDTTLPSGFLTPIGKFTLGSKVAIYKPGSVDFFQDRKTEMITIFGTRWIPFEKSAEDGVSAKGYGLHGAPWQVDGSGNMIEDREKIGKYDSDGCIRLYSEDIEELFSIIISRPTLVEVVKDFHDAKLPGREIAAW